MDFNSFILNEEIIANGKSLDDEEDKKKSPNYSNDKPEEDDTAPEPEDKLDNTDGANTTPDDTVTPEEDDTQPDYSSDSPDGEDGGDGTDTTGDDADPDNTDTTPDDTQPDYSSDSPDGEDDQNPDDGIDATPDDTANPEEDDQPDYSSDSPDGEDGGDGTDATGDDADSSAGSMTDDEIKQLETDLFSNMSPEQIAIKQTDLKTQFITLYSNIEKVIERLAKVNRVEDNIRPLEFVTRKLLELKDLVRDSLIQSYDTRSYVENQIILQRHMAIFATISNIIEELGKKKK